MKRYSQLITEINKCKPKVIFEVGVWKGTTAVKMIRAAQKHNKDITYYGFDLFEGMTPDVKEKEIHAKINSTEAEARKRIYGTGCRYLLTVGNTLDTLPQIVDEVVHFNTIDIPDFVFIDGGHSLETIKSDWHSISQMMLPNETVVIFDDYYSNDTTKGCKAIIDDLDEEFTYEILPSTDKVKNDMLDSTIHMVKVTWNG